jgi:putative ABC transport system substrate-binding protein
MSAALRRLSFFVLLFVLSVLAPPAGYAETVGVVLTRDVLYYEKLHNALTARLVREGFDRRVKFIVQRPFPDPIALSNAARKLIAADVDAIVTYGAPATVAAVREKSRIPVLYAGVYEPIASELGSRLATGIKSKLQVSSLLRYLKASTALNSLGVVYCSFEEDSARQFQEIKKLADKYGIALKPLNLKRPGDVGMLADFDVNAVMITSSSMASGVLPAIIRIAEGKKIPTASLLHHGEPMPTITLTSDPESEGGTAAEILLKVLNGAAPNSIAPTGSKDVELVFNLRDARSMGIRISMDLVTEATRIIY